MPRSRYTALAALGAVLVVAGWFSPPVHAADIPGFPGWDSRTVGDTEQGSASIDANGVLTVSGAGQDTWGREVLVTQLRDRGPDERYIVRVLSRAADNAVSFTPPGVHAPVRR